MTGSKEIKSLIIVRIITAQSTTFFPRFCIVDDNLIVSCLHSVNIASANMEEKEKFSND